MTHSPPVAVLRGWREALEAEVTAFTRELVEGVGARLEELDRLIGAHAEGWTVARMAAVDRAILRLACFELLYRPDVPPAVAISEAVEAAGELSTEGSVRFVNGILGRISREMAGGAGQ
jgi:transcription antitermination protein NusB